MSEVDNYIARLVRDGSEQLAQIRDLKSHIKVLEDKLEQCSQAWYFPSEDMTQRAMGRVVCMCGEQMRFTDESRKSNCQCGRRWLWRWTGQGQGES